MSKNKKPDQNLELLIRLIGAVGQFLIGVAALITAFQ